MPAFGAGDGGSNPPGAIICFDHFFILSCIPTRAIHACGEVFWMFEIFNFGIWFKFEDTGAKNHIKERVNIYTEDNDVTRRIHKKV